MRPAAKPLILLVRFYRATLGLYVGGHCRFNPTCSQYAIEALQSKGALRGSWLTLRRLLRCHPLGGRGYDPVALQDDDASTDNPSPKPGAHG